MIKGMAKVEFGTGDILMTSVLSNNIGALCCATQEESHEIGETVPLSNKWIADDSEVILTFSKVESIDGLIAELKTLKSMMDGTYPLEKLTHKQILDFNAFMQKEK